MVISYTIPQLNEIGEKVLLRRCISKMQPQEHQHQQDFTIDLTPTTNHNFEQEFLLFQQQLQQQLGHQIPVNREISGSYDQPLTSSVADFFRKAQQNFYAQSSIDPTKVRRLSEVEAELIGNRRDSR